MKTFVVAYLPEGQAHIFMVQLQANTETEAIAEVMADENIFDTKEVAQERYWEAGWLINVIEVRDIV